MVPSFFLTNNKNDFFKKKKENQPSIEIFSKDYDNPKESNTNQIIKSNH
jgi:hypothetical protein